MADRTETSNGVNVDQPVGTINAVKRIRLARCKFRAETEGWWRHSRTTIQGFTRGQEDTSRSQPFT
jgi:P2-related tail formation protein